SPASPAKITAAMPNELFLKALRSQLLEQFGSSCLKCHAPQAQGEAFAINWHAAGHATRVAGYVTFTHRPHLTLFPGNDKCTNCHQLQTTAPAPMPGKPS